ncbi:MAG: type VI secretion system tip protein VgrG [Gemmatimonadaceae bacterium]
MPRSQQLISASVTKAANRIATARLVYLDGSPASGDFPLSNGKTFVPGTEVEVQAGTTNDPVSIFSGLVVKQSLKVRDHSAPQLILECRHKVIKLAVGRKSAYFHDQSDSDIIESLLSGAGVKTDIESTSVKHKQLVQYCSTDWDFLLTRAEANGRLVFTNDANVAVRKPAMGSAQVTLLLGATVLEMDAEIDSRDQFEAVQSQTWDSAQQEVLSKDAADPQLKGPGNFTTTELADVVGLDRITVSSASVPEDEAQAWADAAWLKSKLSKASGRIKCEGIATINPGDTVSLGGVGDRLNGDVFVTGVRHEFDLVQGWKTHIQFGGTTEWFAEETQVSAPRAGALLPAVNGLQIGVVVGNEDPDGEHRVQVRMPLVNANDEGAWCRVAAVDAGDDRGFFFRPEIGDEVVLGFLNDDPRQAVVLGMLHSSAKPAPLTASDANDLKVYQSRAKMKLSFDDSKKTVVISTPAGNSITLSEDETAIKIADQNGNKIEMTADGITIESAKALTLKAGTEVNIESGTSMSAKGGTSLKLEGSASVELSSSAATVVKGTPIKLN